MVQSSFAREKRPPVTYHTRIFGEKRYRTKDQPMCIIYSFGGTSCVGRLTQEILGVNENPIPVRPLPENYESLNQEQPWPTNTVYHHKKHGHPSNTQNKGLAKCRSNLSSSPELLAGRRLCTLCQPSHDREGGRVNGNLQGTRADVSCQRWRVLDWL